MTLGVLHVCYVSWLHQVHPNDITHTQYTAHSEVEQVVLKTCRDP
jgi:hypothetical protein